MDQDYFLRLLAAFGEAANATTDIQELQRAGFSLGDPRFELHLRLLYEERFIASDFGGIGLDTAADGHKMWSVIPLRLTAAGHAEIEAMNSEEPVGKIGFDYSK
jgi:hypothetical protein